MKHLILALLFFGLMVRPGVAGCGGAWTHYAEVNEIGTCRVYMGVDSIPTLPGDVNETMAIIVGFPAWMQSRPLELTTVAEMALVCGIEPNDLLATGPPDCNTVRPITYWGNPYTMFNYKLPIDYNCPPDSFGVYNGFIRLMGANEIVERPARFVVNKEQQLFFYMCDPNE